MSLSNFEKTLRIWLINLFEAIVNIWSFVITLIQIFYISFRPKTFFLNINIEKIS